LQKTFIIFVVSKKQYHGSALDNFRTKTESKHACICSVFDGKNRLEPATNYDFGPQRGRQDHSDFTKLENHTQASEELTDRFDILRLFEQYMKYGDYPFSRMGGELYYSRLLETTHLVLEMDIGPFEEISYKTVRSMKKLLYLISESVPFTPNISKLAEKLETSRNTVLKILDMLQQAQIINLLYQSVQGISFLQKPEKIYLQNPNLAFALSPSEPNTGNLRETFFMNQLQVSHQVTLPKFGDFMVDDQFVFEIGGPNKTAQQIQGVPNAYLALDQIKIGSGNKIPLWLFGFLY